MNIKEIVRQIKACEFECEAGSIELNTAFVELEVMAQILPEHNIGDRVWVCVSVKENGITLTQYVRFTVCGIEAVGLNQTAEIKFMYEVTANSLTNVKKIHVYKKYGVDQLHVIKPETLNNTHAGDA